MKSTLILLFGLISPAASAATTAFNITVNYSGNEIYGPMFEQAASIWESIIPSYIDGTTTSGSFTGITISATIGAVDGPGLILGSAGPSLIAYDNSGYVLATDGDMLFDEADIAGLGMNFVTVILHEMGHVLGIGSLWTYNGAYENTTGQYTGEHGLAAYRAEFNQPTATFVPVEMGGGEGTEDGHWDEIDDGTVNTGIVSSYSGSDMRYELMTGWLVAGDPYFISDLTRGSLRDLGYNVNMLAPVPEVSTPLLLGFAWLGLAARRRR